MHCMIPAMKFWKAKIFIFLFFVVYLFLLYVVTVGIRPKPVLKEKKDPVIKSVKLPYVIVHIDFKGSPPKLDYLETLLPHMKRHGANGLLMEYEDMFPYEGKLVNISSRNCYTPSQLSYFLYIAAQAGFEIIPLIQTFGHLEHVLKLQEFSHLREVPIYPDSICPSKQESLELIGLMLEQVARFHNNIVPLKYIHIGCDEVYHIKACSECVKLNTSRVDLFINHVRSISEIVKDISPNTTVLIWDDMFRKMEPQILAGLKVFDNIEPVYWDYSSKVKVTHVSLFYYHKKFKNIWAASAFKGADGFTASFPLLSKRSLNHFKWMNIMLDYKFAGESTVFKFKGIILTGWSRYSHMDPPCELLPVSYPSLILNLLIIKKFKTGVPVEPDFYLYKLYSQSIQNEFSEYLKCRYIPNIGDLYDTPCNFDGMELSNILKHFNNPTHYLQKVLGYKTGDLFSLEYYLETFKYMNKNRWSSKRKLLEKSIRQLEDLETKLYETMKLYYFDDFIKEYIDYKTVIKRKIIDIHNHLSNVQYWDRGPLIFKPNVTVY